MTIHLVSDEKIAETSSKGNQEKWLDVEADCWYKLDQFGYEALSETLISILLKSSNIETDTPFTFVRYRMERMQVHGVERTGCASKNFLKPRQSLITVNRLLTNFLGLPLKQKLAQLTSNKKRIAFLGEAVAEYTGLKEFSRYLTAMFEIDALFCNDDRHLNNIAVIEEDGKYAYCPIFDNGAGLLSNTQLFRMDVASRTLISALRAWPFNTTFTRQANAAASLTGKQLVMPQLTASSLRETVDPLLQYYPRRDQSIIADRIVTCILTRQKYM